MIDESKNVQTTPTRTHCKCSRPLPYCYPNCRTPRHWKFTQHHRTTRPPPWSFGVRLVVLLLCFGGGVGARGFSRCHSALFLWGPRLWLDVVCMFPVLVSCGFGALLRAGCFWPLRGRCVCVFVCVWRLGPVGLVWASSGLLLAAQGRCFYGRSSVWRVVLSACPGLIGAGWLIAEASHRFGLWWGLGLLCVRWGQRGNIWIFFSYLLFPIFFNPLWETAWFGLKYCLNYRQPTEGSNPHSPDNFR